MTLKMGVPTVAVGRRVRPTVMVFALARKGRVNILVLGSTGSRYRVFTLGLVATLTGVSGFKENGMD